jgi:hypothetical protein
MQHVTPRHTTYFFMRLQFQIVAKHVHHNCLQAPTLINPLMARKLHVKTTLYEKRECVKSGLLLIQISFLSIACLTCTLPQDDCA